MAPISGPNIASSATMSLLEMVQFGNWLIAKIFMNFCLFFLLLNSSLDFAS